MLIVAALALASFTFGVFALAWISSE